MARTRVFPSWRRLVVARAAVAGAALMGMLALAAGAGADVLEPPTDLELLDDLVARLPVVEASAPAPLALANPYVIPGEFDVSISGNGRKTPAKPKATRASTARRSRHGSPVQLTPERAQALLRSLAVPGWGQATLGHPTAARVFGVLEAGVWGSFTAFKIQQKLRSDASLTTARLFAGVDLRGKDEEFKRIVGFYASSDEYNQLVVARDAANQYYDDPELYREYIAKHSIGGDLAWSWQDERSFDRYAAQRKDAHRASMRANTALACAIGNRILSVLHTARVAGRKTPAPAHAWNFEVTPVGGEDPTAYRFALRTSF